MYGSLLVAALDNGDSEKNWYQTTTLPTYTPWRHWRKLQRGLPWVPLFAWATVNVHTYTPLPPRCGFPPSVRHGQRVAFATVCR